MVRESDRLVVVDLAERGIDWQLVGQRLRLARIDVFVERVRVADQRVLQVRQIGDGGVVRVRAGGRRERIRRVAGQQQMLREIQDARGVPSSWCGIPVRAGSAGSRSTPDRDRDESRDVREPLLLVDNQVVDQIQILGARLLGEVRRRIPIEPAVVHVNVKVAAPHLRKAGRARQSAAASPCACAAQRRSACLPRACATS